MISSRNSTTTVTNLPCDVVTCGGMIRLASIMVVLVSIRAQTANAQWMVGAYLGWAAPFKTNVRIDSLEDGTRVQFDHLQFKTRSFENHLYYGLRAGRMFGAENGDFGALRLG